MTPADFIKAGQRLYGRKKWKFCLARDLGINVSTVHRMTQLDTTVDPPVFKRAQIPGPCEIALKAMLENKKARDKLEKEARKLLPRKLRKRKTPRKPRAATRLLQRDRSVLCAVAAQPDTGKDDS
jgi:hypothetical protein